MKTRTIFSLGGVMVLMAGAGCFCSAETGGSEARLRDRWMQRSNGVHSLFEAAAAGDMNTLRARINEGDDVNKPDEMGNLPLHMAAEAGHAPMVTLLIKSGADPMAKNREGKRPAELAADDATRAACEAAESARKREIDLFPAIRANKADEVAAALKDGVNPNGLTEDNQYPMVAEAVRSGSMDVLQALLNAKARVDVLLPAHKSLLHLAGSMGRAEMIPVLLKAGVDPMVQSGNGAYAIHDAIWAGKTEAAIALIPAYKAVKYNPDGKGNGYPIHMAISRNNAAVVKALLQAGLNPNDPVFANAPLLIAAARQNNEEMVRLLLKAGANKNAKDSSGKTAADYASGNCAKLLQGKR